MSVCVDIGFTPLGRFLPVELLVHIVFMFLKNVFQNDCVILQTERVGSHILTAIWYSRLCSVLVLSPSVFL